MKFISILIVIWMTMINAEQACAYPLDGYEHTGIARLEGLRLAQQGKIPGPGRVIGAQISINQVDLRLEGFGEIKIPDPDPDLSDKIRKLLGEDANAYAIAVLDVTNGSAPLYASVNGSSKANPGSVGKLVVALAVFQALADIYPEDIQKRLDILRNTMVRADDFIVSDHHKVPIWKGDKNPVQYRAIKTGDQANLWTYLDWMMSASSNAAAAMVQKELMLMNRFKDQYPVSQSKADAFFTASSKQNLQKLLAKSLQEPLERNGINLKELRQGSFFTRNGKKKVPGTTSHASPKELIKYLLKLEQGLLVDAFSSREIKRLMYMTGKRIRYASAPALYSSAVYFKSGSLYKCRPEPDFSCDKYQGNTLNQLSSVAIVEFPASEPQMHYMVAVMSNVLYKNSAVAHQTLATRLHRLLEKEYKKKMSNFETESSQK